MASSMRGEKIDISIVIPVKNEAENILPLAKELESAMEKEFAQWECIWVDDGSSDGSLVLLGELARADPSSQVYLLRTKRRTIGRFLGRVR